MSMSADENKVNERIIDGMGAQPNIMIDSMGNRDRLEVRNVLMDPDTNIVRLSIKVHDYELFKKFQNGDIAIQIMERTE